MLNSLSPFNPPPPSPENQQYSTGNQQYSTGNQQYSTGNQQYSTGNQQYNSSNQQYSTGNQQYNTGNQQYNNTGNQQYNSGNEQYNNPQRPTQYYSPQNRSGSFFQSRMQKHQYNQQTSNYPPNYTNSSFPVAQKISFNAPESPHQNTYNQSNISSNLPPSVDYYGSPSDRPSDLSGAQSNLNSITQPNPYQNRDNMPYYNALVNENTNMQFNPNNQYEDTNNTHLPNPYTNADLSKTNTGLSTNGHASQMTSNTYNGWLHKLKSNSTKSYNRRYFIIDFDTCTAYYKRKIYTKNVVLLPRITHAVPLSAFSPHEISQIQPKLGAEFGFILYCEKAIGTNTSREHYYLFTTSAADMNAWVNEFNRLIKTYPKKQNTVDKDSNIFSPPQHTASYPPSENQPQPINSSTSSKPSVNIQNADNISNQNMPPPTPTFTPAADINPIEPIQSTMSNDSLKGFTFTPTEDSMIKEEVDISKTTLQPTMPSLIHDKDNSIYENQTVKNTPQPFVNLDTNRENKGHVDESANPSTAVSFDDVFNTLSIESSDPIDSYVQ